MTHRDVTSIPISLPPVRASIKDLSKATALANRPVGRLDPRPLQRATTGMTHVPTLRRFSVIVSAVVRPWGQQAVRGQVLGTAEPLDSSHLREDRIAQDVVDPRKRP